MSDLGTDSGDSSTPVDLNAITGTSSNANLGGDLIIPPPNLDAATGTGNNANLPKSASTSPTTTPFNNLKWREGTRTFLSIALFVSIGLTQLSVICYLFIPILIPPLIQILGKEKKDNNPDKNPVKLGNSTFLYIVGGEKEDKNKDAKELITLIWTSQITLIGSALGFYFASNKDKD